MAAVLKGDVKAIIITGGFAKVDIFTIPLTERVQFIANVTVIPGEFEMEALASGAIRVLKGQEHPKIYQ